MRNFIQKGETFFYVNGGAAVVPSGAAVVSGGLIGVAAGDIAPGDSGTASAVGVYRLPKKAGAAIPQGTRPVWSVADKAFVPEAATQAAGDVAGAVVAWEAAAAADTVVHVKLAGAGVVKV